jgi:hypothetical protein
MTIGWRSIVVMRRHTQWLIGRDLAAYNSSIWIKGGNHDQESAELRMSHVAHAVH